MAKKFSIPRGTADILPEAVGSWQRLEKISRRVAETYGYKEIRTPAFEETGLFSRSLGSTTDIVQKQMLNLEKDGLSLRPEGTAPIVRSYIENSIDKKQSLSKLYYIAPMFRGERPQKGRLRQFNQIGVEAIGPGSSSPYLDAEVIALAVEMIESFGLNDFDMKINTLGTIKEKAKAYDVLKKELKSQVKNLCGDCKDRYTRNPFRVLDCKKKECRQAVKNIKFGSSWLGKESQDYFNQVKKALDSLNMKYIEDPCLVRGLDYYTGTVFEISSKSLGSQDALGAGGRYDNLISNLGGSKVDAVGFALGIERILLALPKENKPEILPLTTYIIALDERSFQRGFQILNILRSEGIRSDMSYRKGASVKSQMRSADKIGSRSVIVIGETEINEQWVAIKDMKETDVQKKEEKVSIEDCDYSILVDALKRLEERYKNNA